MQELWDGQLAAPLKLEAWKVQLTAAGQVFFEESQKILLQVDRAIQLGKQTSRGELSQLTIGFVSFAAENNLVPAILEAFRTLAR